MNEELQLALQIPTKEEILNILEINVANYNLMSENDILKYLMRYFKGRCNPAHLRQIIKEL